MSTGIYIIETELGHFYIGQSADIDKRLSEHFSTLANGTHYNPYLQAVFNKYGIDLFSADILENCSAEELKAREQFYLDKWFTDRLCMNVNPIACGGATRPIKITDNEGNSATYNSLVEASNSLDCTDALICIYLKRGHLNPPQKGRFVGYTFEYLPVDKRPDLSLFIENNDKLS